MRFVLKKIVSPFWQWILVLVLIPSLELFLFLHFFGTAGTLLTMFVCGLLGVSLAYRTGNYYWAELNQHLDRGETPMLPALHGVLVLFAVLLMVLPGILTGLVGLFLLLPLTRAFVVSYLILQIEARRLQERKKNAPFPPEIIDV